MLLTNSTECIGENRFAVVKLQIAFIKSDVCKLVSHLPLDYC